MMSKAALEHSISGIAGQVSLSFRSAMSGTGSYHFFAFCSAGRTTEQSHAVWNTELEWLCRSLLALSTRLEPRRFDKPGWYPLCSAVSANGGLLWNLEVDEAGASLVLRRYTGSFRKQDGEQSYTRYFQYSRQGRFIQKVNLPITTLQDGSLGEFASVVAERLRRVREDLRASLPSGSQQLPEEALFHQVCVDGDLAGIGTPSLTNGHLLPQRILPLLLSRCAQASTPADLSQQLPLREEVIRRLLAWPRRYDAETLAEGYLLAPTSAATGEAVLAVRDSSIFACDPLLTSLDPEMKVTGLSGVADWVRAPQSNPRQFQKALDQGWADETIIAALGQAPIPTPERAQMIRRFVSPPAILGRYRWRVLQLMVRYVAEATNFLAGMEDQPVVLLQRLALLRRDLAEFFPRGESVEVDLMLAEAGRHHGELLTGRQRPLEVDDRHLPQPERA